MNNDIIGNRKIYDFIQKISYKFKTGNTKLLIDIEKTEMGEIIRADLFSVSGHGTDTRENGTIKSYHDIFVVDTARGAENNIKK